MLQFSYGRHKLFILYLFLSSEIIHATYIAIHKRNQVKEYFCYYSHLRQYDQGSRSTLCHNSILYQINGSKVPQLDNQQAFITRSLSLLIMKSRKNRHVSSSSNNPKGMNKTTAKLLGYGLSTLKIILSITAFLCTIQLLSSMKSIGYNMISIPIFVRRIMVYVYMIINAFTLIAFGYDKTIAITNPSSGMRRISEVSLFKYCAIGGVSSAIIAMELFHHKTKKTKFVNIIYGIAFLQIMFVWYAFYADKIPFIRLSKS